MMRTAMLPVALALVAAASAAGGAGDNRGGVMVREVTLDADAWRQAPELPAPVSNHQVLAVNGSILCIGGRGRNGKPVAEVLRSRIAGNGNPGKWERLSPLPYPCASFAAGEWKGRIYLAGGMRATAKGEVLSGRVLFCQADKGGTPGNWRESAGLPDPVYGHGVAFYDKWIYVVGGMAGDGYRNTVWKGEMGPDGKVASWKATVSMPVPLAHAGVLSVGDKIVVVGGQSPGESKTLIVPTVYVAPLYKDGEINTWYLASSKLPGAWLGFGRSQTSVVMNRGAIFGFGGQDASWFYLSNIVSAVFDLEKGEVGTWGVSDGPPDMPQATSAATWKDFVYLVGGMAKGRITGKVVAGRFKLVEREEKP